MRSKRNLDRPGGATEDDIATGIVQRRDQLAGQGVIDFQSRAAAGEINGGFGSAGKPGTAKRPGKAFLDCILADQIEGG